MCTIRQSLQLPSANSSPRASRSQKSAGAFLLETGDGGLWSFQVFEDLYCLSSLFLSQVCCTPTHRGGEVLVSEMSPSVCILTETAERLGGSSVQLRLSFKSVLLNRRKTKGAQGGCISIWIGSIRAGQNLSFVAPLLMALGDVE